MVDAFFPFFLLGRYADDDGRSLVAPSVEEAVDLSDLTRDGGVDVSRDEASGLSDDCTDFDEVALLHGRDGRSADVLAYGDDDLTW